MPKSVEKKQFKAVLEYESAKDADVRLRRAFGIIFSGIIIKKMKSR